MSIQIFEDFAHRRISLDEATNALIKEHERSRREERKAASVLAAFLLLFFGLLAILLLAMSTESCTPQAPAQTVESLSYNGALDACTLQAKTDDGGRPEADACMCRVAMRYGALDSGVLGCLEDGGVR